MSTPPTKRTWFKTGRDALVIAIPAVLIWITGHAVDIQGFGLSAESTAKLVGYSTTGLLAWRAWRDFRGTGPV